MIIALAKFLKKYPNKWHSFDADLTTVGTVCAAQNLGFLECNAFGQMKTKSIKAIDQYLKSKGQS